MFTGCWDQRPIKDRIILNGIGFDLNKEKKIELSSSVLNIIGKGTGMFDLENELTTVIGNSIIDSSIKIQSVLPGGIETSKTRLFLLGEEFSRVQFDHLLDYFNRTSFTNVNVNIVITKKQTAKDILSLKPLKKPISFIIADTLDRSKRISIIPNIDLQKIYTLISEDGIDLILPVVDKTETNQVEVKGAGLFHKGSYTGKYIEKEESPLLMTMMNQHGEVSLLVTKIPNAKNIIGPYNIFSYEVRRPSSKINIHASKNKIDVDVKMNLTIKVLEETTEENLSKKVIQSIIQKDLNARAQKVIDDIQQANSDVLGIGRYLREHEPKLWKSLDWEKEYPTINIQPDIKIHLASTGALET